MAAHLQRFYLTVTHSVVVLHTQKKGTFHDFALQSGRCCLCFGSSDHFAGLPQSHVGRSPRRTTHQYWAGGQLRSERRHRLGCGHYRHPVRHLYCPNTEHYICNRIFRNMPIHLRYLSCHRHGIGKRWHDRHRWRLPLQQHSYRTHALPQHRWRQRWRSDGTSRQTWAVEHRAVITNATSTDSPVSNECAKLRVLLQRSKIGSVADDCV
jgi:hypothetical protein